jgi:tetratricopeptide (TPR) repeat protein
MPCRTLAALRAVFGAAILAAAGTLHGAPAFVGTEACTGCHAAAAAAWKGSHHDLAMQEPAPAAVLGDFSGATFRKDGITTTFTKQGERFVIRTEGPDRKLADYEVKYVFGVAPLQQYLLALPGGRLQAFTIAWDTRPKAQGGQRWFDLYPKEKLRPGDELHWTGRQNNWNFMCADCHSTNLAKGYDAKADRYATTWSSLNVGCEACHGPGSDHVAWAKAGARGDARKGLAVLLDERKGVSWLPGAATGIAKRSVPRTTTREIEVCAQCHSRRAQVAESYHAGRRFLDHYRPALLEAGLYAADGQQFDEVYNWGSFLQSRMYAAGVTCADCHDPHSGKTTAPASAVCARCHLPAKFDDPKHHFHKPGSKGAECISCHMPARLYMVVDARRDHSFRIPRPDLTVKLGTPNACGDCHRREGAGWAAEAIAKRRPGTNLPSHYAGAIAAGRAGAPGAERLLADVATRADVPGIVRATAVSLLPAVAGSATPRLARRLPADADPLVRLASLGIAPLAPPRIRLDTFGLLLSDPVRVVRMEAASALAGVPRGEFPPALLGAFDAALAEYRATQHYNADRPEAWINLGRLEARLGNSDEAKRAYETAIQRAPDFIPARVALADLWRDLGRDDEAQAALQEAVKRAPGNPDARHALGLALVRAGRREAALAELERAAQLAPANARYAYVLGVAQHDMGRQDAARATLEQAHRRHPGNRDILEALAAYAAEAGNAAAAARWRAQLEALGP